MYKSKSFNGSPHKLREDERAADYTIGPLKRAIYLSLAWAILLIATEILVFFYFGYLVDHGALTGVWKALAKLLPHMEDVGALALVSVCTIIGSWLPTVITAGIFAAWDFLREKILSPLQNWLDRHPRVAFAATFCYWVLKTAATVFLFILFLHVAPPAAVFVVGFFIQSVVDAIIKAVNNSRSQQAKTSASDLQVRQEASAAEEIRPSVPTAKELRETKAYAHQLTEFLQNIDSLPEQQLEAKARAYAYQLCYFLAVIDQIPAFAPESYDSLAQLIPAHAVEQMLTAAHTMSQQYQKPILYGIDSGGIRALAQRPNARPVARGIINLAGEKLEDMLLLIKDRVSYLYPAASGWDVFQNLAPATEQLPAASIPLAHQSHTKLKPDFKLLPTIKPNPLLKLEVPLATRGEQKSAAPSYPFVSAPDKFLVNDKPDEFQGSLKRPASAAHAPFLVLQKGQALDLADRERQQMIKQIGLAKTIAKIGFVAPPTIQRGRAHTAENAFHLKEHMEFEYKPENPDYIPLGYSESFNSEEDEKTSAQAVGINSADEDSEFQRILEKPDEKLTRKDEVLIRKMVAAIKADGKQEDEKWVAGCRLQRTAVGLSS